MNKTSPFWGNTPPQHQGGVVAIGNFDGVHLGHGAVLRAAHVRAEKEGLPVTALTFEPHPYAFFNVSEAPFLLTPLPDKTELLKQAGVDEVAVLPFTSQFAALTPQGFVEEILVKTLNPQHVVVGEDFVFGAKRAGTQAILRNLLAQHSIDLVTVPSWHDQHGDVVSSTRIRSALRRGDPLLARQLLGRPFTVTGRIIHGDQRGREMGFPTANLTLNDYVRPFYGVYAGTAYKCSAANKRYAAVINIGTRPTVDGARELLEAHLLNFDADIYDQTWRIELRGFLRPEQKFISLTQLQEQIAADIKDVARFSDIVPSKP